MKDMQHRRSGPLSRAAIIVACGWLPLVSAGCSRSGAVNPADSPTARSSLEYVLPAGSRGVTTAFVKMATLPEYLEAGGQIQADPTRIVHVYAPVSGRLISVQARPADYVRQGQVLATLASSDVAAARAAYRQAQADAGLKQEALARSQSLYEHKAIALKDYQQAQADAQTAQAALESARERLALLGVDAAGSSDEILVRAPRPGIVLDLGAAAGEFSKSLDSSSPLCTLADLRTVWAVANVYEKDLASVKLGQAAFITTTAYPGRSWRGRVTAIGGALDPTTRTLDVRVVLPNPGTLLKPGMFATIRLVRAARSAVIVPQSAILHEGSSASVFVERSGGRFERRAVALGRSLTGDQVEIVSGLGPGERVVVEGADLLAVGAAPQ